MFKSNEYHVDGTFKNCPKIFYQLMTMHVVLNSEIYPVAFILSENKYTETYDEAFGAIRKICFEQNKNLQPERFLFDFEPDLMKAIMSFFPESQIKGRWFHFTQSLKRKLFSIGLKQKYLNDQKFKIWARQFSALALIPTNKIKDGMNIIIENLPEDNDKIRKFI